MDLKNQTQKRTIKFRAWDESQNYMAYQGMPDLESIQSFMHHFGDKTLMQFTWLHDKNGKEIFEGDKLRDDYSDEETVIEDYAVVVWDGKLCQWAIDNSFAKDGSSFTNMVEYFGRENLEVIGNIHEDSCLLE